MEMKKICPRCKSVVIDADKECCDRCSGKRIERHKEYDRFRRNQKATAFYHSTQWMRMADYIRQVQGGVDLWALAMHKQIVSDHLCVHHIVELSEDWSRRLDPDNLILVSSDSHAEIHARYRTNRADTQQLLRNILLEFRKNNR